MFFYSLYIGIGRYEMSLISVSVDMPFSISKQLHLIHTLLQSSGVLRSPGFENQVNDEKDKSCEEEQVEVEALHSALGEARQSTHGALEKPSRRVKVLVLKRKTVKQFS